MRFDIEDEFFLAFLTAMYKHQVRYMLIGGIAVNFHGIERHTNDMDIWLAPANANRDLFCNALLDLGYTDEELADLKSEDFTTFFKCSIGAMPDTIDCLTFVHPTIDFDQAETEMIKHDIGNGVILNVVNYHFLRKMKLVTHRQKDWSDVARLDELKSNNGTN
ncbi:MAG: hypothetical protein JSU01_05210 [Bacteroidetes bacterium]|nr:hypothetical protein [Bacteroidota bacterium]